MSNAKRSNAIVEFIRHPIFLLTAVIHGTTIKEERDLWRAKRRQAEHPAPRPKPGSPEADREWELFHRHPDAW